ncbi:tail fiber assembly protein [Xenorhabdus cabanillasii]|uniref:Putaive tail fiber assembly protein n=1 Tax=Xenorhabdus cabanillasii JM26 TaxID=1427517 RepID=W1J7J3_9GAMM|nr:tail fiber assembly protein [Xenorhabdus cabanillasii]PHM77922.1 tail fiber assembly protein [Xenorhabdus cabanillasii JM26]CDL86732.1 Putaive tail fiber assembly protein [Xenorhabdus cabanillasii JM26]
MKYYRDSNNQVYAYSNQQIATGWVKSGLIPMTDAEVDRHLNPPITKEQYIELAESEKHYRMSQATNAIVPLQDAVDLKMATEAEKSAFTAWRKYRVLLNRVDCSTAPDIHWPEQPK